METTTATSYVRHIAIKTSIGQLLQGTYIQEDENNPNYLLTPSQQKISRLNIIAVILTKEQVGNITNLLVDDGTGSIVIRSFEENLQLQKLQIGDAVLLIGRLRMYNQEKYISPETVKKIDRAWLMVRSLELKKLSEGIQTKPLQDTPGEIARPTPEKTSKEDSTTAPIEDLSREDQEIDKTSELLPVQKMIQLIKELDLGEGVLIEEIIEKSILKESEKLIEKMLENGDIFQIVPGKVKVL